MSARAPLPASTSRPAPHARHCLALGPWTEPARVHDQRRRRRATHASLTVNEHCAGIAAQTLREGDDATYVLLGRALVAEHVGNQQPQLASECVITNRQV